MQIKKLTSLLAAAALFGIVACDNADPLAMPGASLVVTPFEISIDSTFTLNARSVANPKVQSRTTTQLLGAIEAPNYGKLRADMAAQLFPSTNIDVDGVELDSVKLQLVFSKTGFVGDSLAPIGFEVYPLTDTLPYPIYSNTPIAGKFDPDNCMGQGMFTAVGGAISNEAAANAYRFAYASLPKEFGQKILDAFKNPATRPYFNDPEQFALNVFPGVYVRTNFGSGRVTRVMDTRLVLYYQKRSKIANSDGVLVDSLQHLFTYAMVSAPEVTSNTFISYQHSASLAQLINQGQAVVASPAGYDVELTFPIKKVIQSYEQGTEQALSLINTMTFSLPVDSIANGRGIKPPQYLLMVLKKDKDKFFAANKLPDDVTSFTATYNANSMTYNFGNLRNYLLEMMAKGGNLTEDDYTFVLTPVSMVMEDSQSSYYAVTESSLSGMSPMIAMPSLANLLFEKAKIKLTYSKQSLQ